MIAILMALDPLANGAPILEDFEDFPNILKNLHLPFSETMKAKGNYLEKEVIPEEESASWHNTTCYVIKEVNIFIGV